MKLFINAGACERSWKKIIINKANQELLCLSIPNYVEAKKLYKPIKFIFDTGEDFIDLEKDCLIEGISVRKTSKITYHIDKYSTKYKEQCIWALIRSADRVPDDVYIPTSMQDKVEVLKRIRFVDEEIDNECFLANIYLIKIKLICHQSIPIYLTTTNPYVLTDHYVIFRLEDGKYKVTEKLRTFIYINEYNKDKYISLSELC